MAKLTYAQIEHALREGHSLTATLAGETKGLPAGTEVEIHSVGNADFELIQCRFNTQLFIVFAKELNVEIDDQTAKAIQEGSTAHQEKVSSDFPSYFFVSEEVPVLVKDGVLTPLKVSADTDLVDCHAKYKEEGKEIVVVESSPRTGVAPFIFYEFQNFSHGMEQIRSYKIVRRSRFYQEETNHAIYVADVKKLKASIKK